MAGSAAPVIKGVTMKEVRVTQWLARKNKKFCLEHQELILKNYGDKSYIKIDPRNNKIALYRQYK